MEKTEQALQGMKRKGWHRREIERSLENVRAGPSEKTHALYGYSRNIVYWTTILVVLIANMVAAVVLVPVMMLAGSAFVYLVIMLLGLLIGIIFTHLISDIEHLEGKHHVFAALFIPALAVLNILVLLPVAHAYSSLLQISRAQNPLVIVSVYVLAFLLPYLWSGIAGRR